MIDAASCPVYVRAIALSAGQADLRAGARDGIEQAVSSSSSNENALGVSRWRKAIKPSRDLARYPDGSGFELKQALATLRVGQDHIVLGSGSNDVLELVARVFSAAAPLPSCPSTRSSSTIWRRRLPGDELERRPEIWP
jgi:histidinol-phosphate/aromatic aminotransferase/cobyric acid decarboxylase-like protein